MPDHPEEPELESATDEQIEEAIAELSKETARDRAASAQAMAEPQAARRSLLDSAILAGALLTICVVLTFLNLSGGMPFGPRVEPLSDQQQLLQLEHRLEFAIEEIYAYQDEHGRLPAALESIGLDPEDGLEYLLNGEHFSLTAFEGELRVVHAPHQGPEGYAREVP